MQITVEIKDKDLKFHLINMIDNAVHGYFDAEIIKEAKVPSKTVLAKMLMDNPKYMEKVQKLFNKYINTYDAIEDAINDAPNPLMDEIIKACEESYEICEKRREHEHTLLAAKAKEMQTNSWIKALENDGYLVVKKRVL